MDATYSPRTDQRAGVRPISFVLDSMGSLGDPVLLPIRPEDLTRTEPARVAVHQTLGRETTGWVDHFGEGLPQITIAGHTGWGYKPGLGMDGFQAFERLNKLIVHDFPMARQEAINTGRDPDKVKLIFVDLLDNFAYPVAPQTFVLRRSKSRALLYQYNIQLQATSTSVDGGLAQFMPNFGSIGLGLGALDGVLGTLGGVLDKIDGWVSTAVGFVNNGLGFIGGLAKQFLSITNTICNRVLSTVRGFNNMIIGAANGLIGIARDISQAGSAIFRTISAIANLPQTLKASLNRVTSAFTELACIFRNSLRPRRSYQTYDGLYGSSNCASTTGGTAASAYAGANVFSAIQPDRTGVAVTGPAASSLSTLGRSDVVLAPLPLPALGQHMQAVTSGVKL